MAFTGRLGSANSQLGSIVLGLGSTAWQNSLTIDGIAAISETHTLRLPFTITVDGFSAITTTNIAQMGSSVSLDVTSDIAISTTFVGASLTIDGVSAISSTFDYLANPTLSIDGIADVSLTSTLASVNSLSVDSVADASVSMSLTIGKSVSIDAVADITLLPGASSNLSFNIDGIAAISESMGLVFSKSLSVAGVAGVSSTVFVRFFPTLTVSWIATISRSSIGIINKTLTVAGFSSFASPGGVNYPRTLTIAGFSALTSPGGIRYVTSLSIDGFSAVTELDGTGYFKTLSVSGISDIVLSGGFPGPLLLTIAGFSSVSNSVQAAWGPTVALTSIGNVTNIVGGLVFFDQKELLGTSDILALPGFSYTPDPVTLDVISDIAEAEEYIQNLVLTIDGVSDITRDTSYVAGASLSIDGFSSVTIVSLVDFVLTMTLGAGANINIENLWDVLYENNVFSTITVSMALFSNKSQNPSANASVSVAATGVFRRTVTQSLALVHSATYKKATGVSSQTLTLTQAVTCTKIHLESVSQTLTLTQDAVAVREQAQTLVLTQSVIVTKVHFETVVQTLELTQSGDRNTVLNLSVEQTLTFNHERQITAPIIASMGGGNQTQFQYNQPLINVVLRPKKCLVILGVPTKTIVLPCPIFGDSQSYTGELNLKRTMTGDIFTYVKRTLTEKLKYTFNLGTHKAIELREFLVDHAAELVTLHNWKGETWYVFITNNPFEFTHAARWQPQGEKVDITLEFEGIRT